MLNKSIRHMNHGDSIESHVIYFMDEKTRKTK